MNSHSNQYGNPVGIPILTATLRSGPIRLLSKLTPLRVGRPGVHIAGGILFKCLYVRRGHHSHVVRPRRGLTGYVVHILLNVTLSVGGVGLVVCLCVHLGVVRSGLRTEGSAGHYVILWS